MTWVSSFFFVHSLIYSMELELKDYRELERLGLNLQDALRIAKECKTIRTLEYEIYFRDSKNRKVVRRNQGSK